MLSVCLKEILQITLKNPCLEKNQGIPWLHFWRELNKQYKLCMDVPFKHLERFVLLDSTGEGGRASTQEPTPLEMRHHRGASPRGQGLALKSLQEIQLNQSHFFHWSQKNTLHKLDFAAEKNIKISVGQKWWLLSLPTCIPYVY